MKVFFIKLLKFGIIGFMGMLLDFAITYILKEKFKINKFIANSTGFMFAASSNYFFNRVWTFHSENPKIAEEYTIFISISAVGLAINNISLFFFNKLLNSNHFIEEFYKSKIPKKYEKREIINFYLAKFLAVIVTTAWNFLVNYFYTFSK